MEKVVFPFEYGISEAYIYMPILLVVLAAVLFFTVEYSSGGSYPKFLNFYGRYAALLWPALIVGAVFLVFAGSGADNRQNERDELSLQKAFDEVLAGEDLRPEDKVTVDKTVNYAEYTGEGMQAITLSVGSIEMVGNEDEETMSLTFYPEGEER